MGVTGQDLVPFRIEVSEDALADLGDRLDGARWAPEPQGGDHGYGVPNAFVQRLVAHWREHYDWRAWESLLNQYPQFTTALDGTNVHFLHVRSPEPDALPNIVSWNVYDRGGHYAARQAPDLLVQDMREFFGSLPRG
jgi:hypothetical protein